jgi:hypothetical protein
MIENPNTPETADTATADGQTEAQKDAAGILAVLKVAKNLTNLIGTVDPNNCPPGAQFVLQVLYPVATEILFKAAVVQGNNAKDAAPAVGMLLRPLRAFIDAGKGHPLSEELYQLGQRMIEAANQYEMAGETVAPGTDELPE